MSDSLRDQLLKAGFKPVAAPRPHPHQRPRPRPDSRQVRDGAELDLAHAFALRAKAERAERDAAEREARVQAAAKKERKRRLQELLTDKVLNQAEAEVVRNFEFAGKIRRVYVSKEQLAALNGGGLGIVMQGGRALIVARDIALAAQAIAPEAVGLLVDPSAPVEDDGVPDDLRW